MHLSISSMMTIVNIYVVYAYNCVWIHTIYMCTSFSHIYIYIHRDIHTHTHIYIDCEVP